MAHLETLEAAEGLRDALLILCRDATTALLPVDGKDTLNADDRLRDAFEDLRDAMSQSPPLSRMPLGTCKDLRDPAKMASLSLTMTDTLDAGHRPRRAADEGLVGAEEELGNLCNAMMLSVPERQGHWLRHMEDHPLK